ncbi:flagellar hook assembly protein FlgD [Clostridium sp. JS66]|uniref:flagellar hook assembly protein FlgD n=1 Tax=Clostridium sp. JS66 TaxID=3064705 RepID=UPI00298E46D8|nr:flagellar hook capping FlgD N-terminal domain-containing protein [Clostridium sp. JS66]WPC40996.1 flagellar hook capping FlgD N-terminal domain-containing protein [Clostridium sp. JS66]
MAGVNTATNSSDVNKASDSNATKTSKGTRIVKKGQDMDKNAFFKILAAELSNQDPSNAKDGTEYVSQMAQFSSLEQMVNLNTTMKLTGANNLIGKTVNLNKLDPNGKFYTGLVTSVVKSGDTVQLNVLVGKTKDKDGNEVPDIEKFDIENVTEIDDAGSINNYTNTINNTNEFLGASALIGKTVELSEKDSNSKNYVGVVKAVSRADGGIKVTVDIGNNQTKDFQYDEITDVKSS